VKQRKLHTTTRQSSKQLFNVPSVNFNYSFQSWSPLINGFVDQLLVETGPAGRYALSLRSSKPTIGTLVMKLFTNVFSTRSLLLANEFNQRFILVYIKCMFINKLLRHNDVTLFSPLCFLYRDGLLSFILSHYKLLKIFARNSHMLLRIDYISTCVIHFKCTLFLEDIIS